MKQAITYFLLSSVLIISSASAFADSPKNLKEAMQRIEHNMSKLVDHMMKEEYADIINAAEYIANHEEPPMTHRLRIISELGTDFLDFKSHDDNVHSNAIAMQEAAKRNDINAVIVNYGKTLESCNNCHQKYRERIQRLKL